MTFHKFISFTIIIFLIFNNILYALVERPTPVVPAPKNVNWEKMKPYPYTMIIKTNRYGEFNFTREADKSLDGYKKLCKDTKYSMEIPAVALVNKKREIVDLIYPPGGKILFLNIDMDKIYEYNRENISLIKDLEKTILSPDQRDSIIQRIIANSIYHPLGKFCLVKRNNKLMIFAGVLNQSVYLPIECLDNPLRNVIQKNYLIKYFPRDKTDKLTNNRIVEFINKILRSKTAEYFTAKQYCKACITKGIGCALIPGASSGIFPRRYKRSRGVLSGDYMILEDFPLRKDWYVVTTPNTCFWTDYFIVWKFKVVWSSGAASLRTPKG